MLTSLTFVFIAEATCSQPPTIIGTVTPPDETTESTGTYTYECEAGTVYVGDRSADLTITCTDGTWSTITAPTCVCKFH